MGLNNKMNHLDLFSGIGGFALSASWVWKAEHEIHSFIEIDPFCQKVLKKHWPEVPIISDIKEYKHNGTTVDLLTGGFPCQPFSCAGKQRGKEDDRYLWPEMLRIISEVRPTWIIGENVNGIINMGLDQVLSDLENENYEIQPFIIPACAINAPHRRDRIWIVANYVGRRCGTERECRGMAPMGSGQTDNAMPLTESDSDASDAESPKCEQPGRTRAGREGLANNNILTSNSSNKGLQGGKRAGAHEEKKTAFRPASECNNTWNKPWLEVATRLCRVDDGVSRQMDRVNRLKALGNAIVPQVVVPIMQAIKELK